MASRVIASSQRRRRHPAGRMIAVETFENRSFARKRRLASLLDERGPGARFQPPHSSAETTG
jgi:hypothetical protein